MVGKHLKIFDVLGNEVTILINEYKPAGNYEMEFSNKENLVSGVYYYQLKVGEICSNKEDDFASLDYFSVQ